jgi:AAA domain/CHC2 zinc finger
MPTPLPDHVERALEGLKPAGDQWIALCPTHDDRNPSLAIRVNDEDKVIVHCFAGCDPLGILAALGVEPGSSGAEWTPHGDAVAIYDYRDENGQLLFQVLRTADKAFPQRRPDPSSKTGWKWSLGDTRRVLFRLPELVAAVTEGRSVCLCEGEKDALTLVAQGKVATCNPGGAGKWRAEYAAHFIDAKVTIFADKDEPGRIHARAIAASLDGVAAEVWICEAADPYKDIAAQLGAGVAISDVVITQSSGQAVVPDYSPDLHELLSVPEEPYDWVIPNILEKADRVIITGGEGLGKSTILRMVGVQSAIGIHPFTLAPMPALRVLVIDCENSLKQSRRHLRGLAQVAERSGASLMPGMYRMNCRPGGLDLTTSEDAEWLLDRVRVNQPQLLIIGPLYRLHVGNPNDEEVARRVTVVLDAARSLTDCAVMLEAHSGHAEQVGKPRQLRPLGSSLYLRWPEFGYGMARCADDTGETHPEFVDLRAWRGPRDERAWPTLLHKSIGSWPWEASDYAMKKLAQ